MKKYIYLLLTITIIASGAKAQDVKKIGGMLSTLNNQHPEKFVLEDEYVKITYNDAYPQRIDLNIFNKTDKSMEIIWTECYFVLNGNTERVDNAGVSKTEIGLLTTAHVDNMKPQKIASQSNFVAMMRSDKYVFDLFNTPKVFKQTGKPLVNRAVVTLLINGEKKEYPVTIELYTKKSLKK